MSNKVSQESMRLMMQKLKAEKSDSSASSDRKRKYKLSSKELALLELEKKKKMEEKVLEKKKLARSAGVPENFFDSAKTKAFLNLGKAPTKSILKNSSKPIMSSTKPTAPAPPAANSKARGTEWTSSAPVLTEAGPFQKEKSPSAKTLLRTPSGGAIDHLQQEEEVHDEGVTDGEQDKEIPEGFFDDPVMDAKARGIEYKNPEDAEWEAFKKEIAVEVSASVELAAEEQLSETTGRQLEEIDEQMRAWGRVREIEIRKDRVEEKIHVKKATIGDERDDSGSEEELNEAEMDEFLDWRQKKT
eukprot:GFUD01016835.1.p1 GENE.GFUD01016835.1~~GFUD01016835.1.p1  ORF type:complete len:301 (-),score=115.97 GFUD01016835.1:123-1025(-)